jgi:hypothetical protein
LTKIIRTTFWAIFMHKFIWSPWKGNQIVRIFVYWLIVLNNLVRREKSCINFDWKWVGLHFGRFFGADVMITIFCDFCQLLAKKLALLKNQCYDQFFQKLAVVWAKNANYFANFFGENNFKIITSVPGHPESLRGKRKTFLKQTKTRQSTQKEEEEEEVLFPLQRCCQWIVAVI